MLIKNNEALCGLLLKYTDEIILKRVIAMGLLCFLTKFGGKIDFFTPHLTHECSRKYIVILFEISQKNTMEALS